MQCILIPSRPSISRKYLSPSESFQTALVKCIIHYLVTVIIRSPPLNISSDCQSLKKAQTEGIKIVRKIQYGVGQPFSNHYGAFVILKFLTDYWGEGGELLLHGWIQEFRRGVH